MKNFSLILFICILFTNEFFPQSTNDFRTKGSGDWSSTSIWEYYSAGGSWLQATVVPSYDNANQITIRNGHIVTISGNRTVDQLVIDAGGTLSLNTNITWTINNSSGDDFLINGTFNMSTGTLAGSGTIVSNSTINWSGGEIQHPSLTCSSSSSFNIMGDQVKSFRSGRIYLSGNLYWSGTGNIQGGNGAVIDIQSGGSFNVSNNAGIYYDNLGGDYITINVNSGGYFKKVDGSGSTTIATARLNNYGTAIVENGRIILQSDGTHTGSFDVSSSCYLRFNGGTHNIQEGVAFTGAGLVEITNGTVTSTGSINGASVSSSTTLDFSNGEISGSGVVKNYGTINWSGGTISGSGAILNQSSATININGTSTKYISLNKSISNYGTINWNGGDISFWNTSVIYNSASGNFNIKSDASLLIGGESGAKVFNNYGVITKSTSTGTTTFAVTFNNDGGTVNVNTGRITLTGSGALNSNFSIATGAYLKFNGGTYSLTDGFNFSGSGIVEIDNATLNSLGTSPIPNSGSSVVVNLSANAILSGNFNVNGTMNWNGGTISGSGSLTVNASAVLNISGSNDKYISSGKVLLNNGTVNWTGGNISFWNTSTINNQSSGNFNIQTDANLLWGGESGAKTFENNGTITKSIASGITSTDVTFTNYGTLNINNGTFRISGGGTNSGSISAASGATLIFNSDFILSSSSNISGAGTSKFSNGPVTIAGTFNLLGTVLIDGGTANFNQNASIGTFNLSSGYLGGTGTVTINSGEWTGGTLVDNGTLKVSNTALFTISGSGTKFIYTGRTLLNEGTINWTGGNINCFNSSVINNSAGANFNLNCDANIVNDGGTNTFQNNGSITKNSASGTSIVYIVFNNNNNGSVVLNSGNIMLNGGGTHACNFTANAGTIIKFSGGTHNINLGASSTISGTGTIEFSGATATISGTGTYNPSITKVSSGTATFNKDLTLTNLDIVGGTFTGTGNISISNSLSFSSGTISGTGLFTLLNGASSTLSGGAKTIDVRTLLLSNNSTTTWSGGNISLTNGAAITNSSGSTFNSQASATMSGGTFTNNGAFIHSTSSTTEISSAFTNNNLVNIQSGKIYIPGLTNYSSSTKTLTGGTYEIAGVLVLTDKFETNSATTTLNGSGAAIQYRTFSPQVDNNGLRYLKANTTGSNLIFANGFTYTTEVAYSSEITNNGTFLIDVGATFNMNRNSDYTNITISGSGLLQIKGTFNWNQGTMKGGGITRIDTGGVMNVATTSYQKNIEIRTIDNYGTINVTGNGLYPSNCGNQAIINNHPSGVFDILYDTQFFEPYSYSDTLKFFNYGVLRKSAGSGNFYFRVRDQLHNYGLFDIQSGTIILDGGGSCTGNIQISSGAFLNLRIAEYYFYGGVNISGEGTLKMEPGDYSNSYFISTDTTTGVSIGANITFSMYYNSVIKGAGKIQVNGIFYWRGGTMEGGGRTIINPGGVLNFNDGSTKNLKNRTIDIYGSANINTSSTLYALVNQGAVINLYPSSVFDAKTDFVFNYNNTTDSMTFNNYGTFRRSAGTGYVVFAKNCVFNNYNTVDVQSGILKLNGGGTAQSTFQIAPGCQILMEAGNHYWTGNTQLTGGGTLKLYDGNGYNNINLFIQDTTLGSIINIGTTLELGYSSFLKGNGKLIVKGFLLCSYGRLYGDGIIQVDSVGVMTLTNTTYIESRTINNYGTINLQTVLAAINNAKTKINNFSNGVIDLKSANAGTGYYQSYSDSVIFYNYGLLIKSSGSGDSRISETTKFYNLGIVEINSGTLWLYDLKNYANKKVSGGIFKINSATMRIGNSTFSNITIDTVSADLQLSGSIAQLLNYNGSNAIPNIAVISPEGKFTLKSGKHFSLNPISSSFQNNGEISLVGANLTIPSSKTFNNYGTFNCGQDTLKGDGNFIHESNATIGIGHQQGITSSGLTGNIQNTASRTFSSSANYTYYGDSAQVTGSGLTSSVNNLTINNPVGVYLTNDVTINGSLNFTSGKLFTGTDKTVTLGSSGRINGEKSGSYLVGKLNATKTVGTDSTDLGGAGVFINSGTDNLGDVTVQRISGTDGMVTVNGKTSINRKWIISSTNPPVNGRRLTFNWISDDDNGKNLSSMQIWKSADGTNWNNAGNLQNAVSRNVTINTNTFSHWTVSDSSSGANTILTANVKVFLQGCYNTVSGSMNINLTSVLPLSQPYSVSPWNYSGTENVTDIPTDVVDWILVELRSNQTTIVGRRAGFLKSNGSIVDLDGLSKLSFEALPDGNYYVVIKHRNHLPVMSSNTIELNSNSTQYNFTDNLSKAYGTDAMKELSAGVFGLFAGDGNASGTISSTDRNSVWRPQNGQNGYLRGDYNLSGGVTAADRNSYWRVNNGINSQVPAAYKNEIKINKINGVTNN